MKNYLKVKWGEKKIFWGDKRWETAAFLLCFTVSCIWNTYCRLSYHYTVGQTTWKPGQNSKFASSRKCLNYRSPTKYKRWTSLNCQCFFDSCAITWVTVGGRWCLWWVRIVTRYAPKRRRCFFFFLFLYSLNFIIWECLRQLRVSIFTIYMFNW